MVSLLLGLAQYWGVVRTWSQVLSPKPLEVDLCNFSHPKHGSWDSTLHMGSQVLSSKFDMDVYVATFLGGEAQDLCRESGQAKSLTQLPTQISQRVFFWYKIFNIGVLVYINHMNLSGFSRLKIWDFASMPMCISLNCTLACVLSPMLVICIPSIICHTL